MCTPSEGTIDDCTNAEDDDCNGPIDCADAGCQGPFGAMLGECCDGTDNNANSFIDEFACSCSATPDCTPGSVCYTALGACGPRCNTLGGNTFCTNIGLTTCNRRTGECL